jgi:hypothetical protein
MSYRFEPYEVFKGSNAALTRDFYRKLERRGPVGLIARELFRAQKSSQRAKAYRGGNGVRSYKSLAYDKKSWSLEQLCKILRENHQEARMQLDPTGNTAMLWGWKEDPAVNHPNKWVLYCDLGELYGQVSFHSSERFDGPDYPKDWDGKHVSTERILAFAARVLDMPPWSNPAAESESPSLPLTVSSCA